MIRFQWRTINGRRRCLTARERAARLLIISAACLCTTGCGEQEKREGAAIQVAELQFRERQFATPTIEAIQGHSFLCVSTASGNVVIMLDSKFPPYYRQLPGRTSYTIPRDVFESIQRGNLASRTVLNVFESRLREGK